MKPRPRKEKVRPMLKATGIGLPPDLLKWAKLAAMERSTSLQQMVTDALEAHIGKETNRQ